MTRGAFEIFPAAHSAKKGGPAMAPDRRVSTMKGGAGFLFGRPEPMIGARAERPDAQDLQSINYAMRRWLWCCLFGRQTAG
jgi:hypothetical protein